MSSAEVAIVFRAPLLPKLTNPVASVQRSFCSAFRGLYVDFVGGILHVQSCFVDFKLWPLAETRRRKPNYIEARGAKHRETIAVSLEMCT